MYFQYDLAAVNERVYRLSQYHEANPAPLSSSADLVNWHAHSLPGTNFVNRDIAFGNSTYVVVGDGGYIVRGSDLNALQRIDSPVKTLNVYGVAANSNIVVGVIFFFQAEDGIRDKLVTGVQTCALPI